jgi:hypothetical protein
VRTSRFLLFLHTLLFFVAAGASVTPARAQPVETVGSRALGMGGAFVAVANDSSATWWNPAALAAGPFVDVAIARNGAAVDDVLPASRHGAWSFSLATPPFGISYYRLRVTDIASSDPTEQDRADRKDRRAGVGVRSVSVSQFGATILHTLLPGFHAGTTVKYVRATSRSSALAGAEAALFSMSDLLDAGDDLDDAADAGTGDAASGLDVDAGVLAVVGGIRVGALVRNLRELGLGTTTLPRQVRMGLAFDGEAAGTVPITIAVDADLRRYAAGSGERRVVAIGGEHWLRERQVGLRAGVRFNTVGYEDRAATVGLSVAPRAGMYIDGHFVHGGSEGESGWGIAARVSF